jgi:hypothetical protein
MKETFRNTAMLLGIFPILFFACENEKAQDTLKPEITFLNPLSCDTLVMGESFSITAILSDNEELGSYSIDIHNNFDGHGHSTEPETCISDLEKTPLNPYSYEESFSLDAKLKEFTTNKTLTIPEGSDEGDYHLTLTVIDKAGWSTFRIISVKVLER